MRHDMYAVSWTQISRFWVASVFFTLMLCYMEHGSIFTIVVVDIYREHAWRCLDPLLFSWFRAFSAPLIYKYEGAKRKGPNWQSSHQCNRVSQLPVQSNHPCWSKEIHTTRKHATPERILPTIIYHTHAQSIVVILILLWSHKVTSSNCQTQQTVHASCLNGIGIVRQF